MTETYSANGQSLTTIDIAPAHVKAIDGELTITSTGNQRHVVVPGIGPVHAQAGRFEVEPEHGQPHRAFGLDIPAGSEFCAALAAMVGSDE